MEHAREFYIDGAWVEPVSPALHDVVDPSTEEPFDQIALGSAADVDRAVAAARAAFPAWSVSTCNERLALLRRIVAIFTARIDEIAATLSREMGAPAVFARDSQAASGIAHLSRMIEVLESYSFAWMQGTTLIVREPIGVCGLITPWNWPINQIVCKVAPAIAAGCTMVLKPSEVAPLNAVLFAEILHAAGTPKGVFNLVQGEGATVGEAMSAHPDIDFMSFTGSTRAGILVAKAAATTVKRRHAGTRRQVGQHPAARRRFATRRHKRRGRGVWQQRPILRRAHTHVRASRAACRSEGDRPCGSRVLCGRRSARCPQQSRAGGQRDPIQQDPAPDPVGDRRRGRPGDRRRRSAGGPQSRLL